MKRTMKQSLTVCIPALLAVFMACASLFKEPQVMALESYVRAENPAVTYAFSDSLNGWMIHFHGYLAGPPYPVDVDKKFQAFIISCLREGYVHAEPGQYLFLYFKEVNTVGGFDCFMIRTTKEKFDLIETKRINPQTFLDKFCEIKQVPRID